MPVLQYNIPMLISISRTPEDFESNLNALESTLDRLKHRLKGTMVDFMQKGIPAVAKFSNIPPEFQFGLDILESSVNRLSQRDTPVKYFVVYGIPAVADISTTLGEFQSNLGALEELAITLWQKDKEIDGDYQRHFFNTIIPAIVRFSKQTETLIANLETMGDLVSSLDVPRSNWGAIYSTRSFLETFILSVIKTAKSPDQFKSYLSRLRELLDKIQENHWFLLNKTVEEQILKAFVHDKKVKLVYHPLKKRVHGSEKPADWQSSYLSVVATEGESADGKSADSKGKEMTVETEPAQMRVLVVDVNDQMAVETRKEIIKQEIGIEGNVFNPANIGTKAKADGEELSDEDIAGYHLVVRRFSDGRFLLLGHQLNLPLPASAMQDGTLKREIESWL